MFEFQYIRSGPKSNLHVQTSLTMQ